LYFSYTSIYGGFLLLPSKIYKKYQSICNWFLIQQAPCKHRKALSKVRAKNKVKVAFFLTHESVWNTTYSITYYLYILGLNLHFFVCPVVSFGREYMLLEMEKTYQSFIQKGTVTKTYNEKEYLDIKKKFSARHDFFIPIHMREFKIIDIT
jgi:hypothetical protein